MYKIMIVDDSGIVRKHIERSFNTAEFELTAVAENGVQAVQQYRELRPDLITLDLTMPQMDGISCIVNIKEIDPAANILVISALTDKTTGLRALDAGARGFLSKPFTENQLMTALNLLINNPLPAGKNSKN